MGFFNGNKSRANELYKKAEDDPSKVESDVPELVNILDKDDWSDNQHALLALGKIAGEYPNKVKPHINVISNYLKDDNIHNRVAVALIFGNIAEKYPEEVKSYTETIAEFLDNDDKYPTPNRWGALFLANIAKKYPEKSKQYTEKLVNNINSSDEKTRENVILALSSIYGEYPEEIKKYKNKLQKTNAFKQIVGEPRKSSTNNTSNSNNSGCFIATAVYGSPKAKELDILRSYRDQVLLKNLFGRLFTKTYYKTSPPIANIISKSKLLRKIVGYTLVYPLLEIVKYLYDFEGDN